MIEEDISEYNVTRINFEVPDTTNEILNNLIPRGTKANVYRELTNLYIEANRTFGREFLVTLLDGKAELVIKTN